MSAFLSQDSFCGGSIPRGMPEIAFWKTLKNEALRASTRW
jgi:hypothetical protein